MKIPTKVTLCAPGVVSSFTAQVDYYSIPNPNDVVLFEFANIQPLPCRVSHLGHYPTPGDSVPACLVMLERVLLNNQDRCLNVMTAFGNNYKLSNIEHDNEDNDSLFLRICDVLGLDSSQELYEFDAGFSKLIAENFRALLIAEQFCDGPIDEDKIDLKFSSSVVLALHNAILDGKDRENGQFFNLRRVLMDFDAAVNPDGAYKWGVSDAQLNAVKDIVLSKANIE